MMFSPCLKDAQLTTCTRDELRNVARKLVPCMHISGVPSSYSFSVFLRKYSAIIEQYSQIINHYN